MHLQKVRAPRLNTKNESILRTGLLAIPPQKIRAPRLAPLGQDHVPVKDIVLAVIMLRAFAIYWAPRTRVVQKAVPKKHF
jgi:hypothetical protein